MESTSTFNNVLFGSNNGMMDRDSGADDAGDYNLQDDVFYHDEGHLWCCSCCCNDVIMKCCLTPLFTVGFCCDLLCCCC